MTHISRDHHTEICTIMSETNPDISVSSNRKTEDTANFRESEPADKSDDEDSYREKNSVHSSDEEDGEDVLDGLVPPPLQQHGAEDSVEYVRCVWLFVDFKSLSFISTCL